MVGIFNGNWVLRCRLNFNVIYFTYEFQEEEGKLTAIETEEGRGLDGVGLKKTLVQFLMVTNMYST